jgi:hypothetical protein
LGTFWNVSGMEIIMQKTLMLFHGLEEGMERKFVQIFPLNCCSLDNGVKYLGFHIIPNNYKF